MKSLYFLFFGIVLLSYSSCAQSKITPGISKIEWLVGSWQGTYNGKPFYEAWRKMDDSTLINFTIEINDRDTIIKENGIIRNGQMQSFFQGNTSMWKISKLNDSEIILVNDTLKYANTIIWAHSKKDHWLTEIQNPTNTINYDLTRVAWLEHNIDQYASKAEEQRSKPK